MEPKQDAIKKNSKNLKSKVKAIYFLESQKLVVEQNTQRNRKQDRKLENRKKNEEPASILGENRKNGGKVLIKGGKTKINKTKRIFGLRK